MTQTTPLSFRIRSHPFASPAPIYEGPKFGYSFWFEILLGDDDKPLCQVCVRFSSDVLDAATPGRIIFGPPQSAEDVAALERALYRQSVALIERALRDGSLPPREDDTLTIVATEADARVLQRLQGDKLCDYQLTQSGHLYCTAASPNDDERVGMFGLHTIAPTSRPVCRQCELPDTDYICSHLMHPEVFGIRTMGSSYVRQLMGATCDLGRKEINTDPAGCRAGGHECWERVIEPQVGTSEMRPATALGDEIDHLDAAWQVTFSEPLVHLKRVGRIGELTTDAASESEFDSRLSALGELMDSLQIPDRLIPEEVLASRPIPAEHSLTRIREALRPRLDPPAFAPVDRAIRDLQDMRRVRAAAQHPQSPAEGRSVFARLGIPWPIEDHPEAWRWIRSRSAEAVAIIRKAVRALPPR